MQEKEQPKHLHCVERTYIGDKLSGWPAAPQKGPRPGEKHPIDPDRVVLLDLIILQ